MLRQQFRDPIRDAPAQLVAATTEAVRVNDALIAGDRLFFESHAALARRSPAYDVVYDPKIVHVHVSERPGDPRGKVAEEPCPRLRHRVRVPVVGFLSPADYGTPLEPAGDAKTP